MDTDFSPQIAPYPLVERLGYTDTHSHNPE